MLFWAANPHGGRLMSVAVARSKAGKGRYRGDLTAGSLKVAESRVVAGLLLDGLDESGWKDAIVRRNVLKASNPATARRLNQLIRGRLELMDRGLWLLVRDGSTVVATQATLAAAVKHSALLGDFLDLVVREQYGRFADRLTYRMWEDYLDGCRGRDPDMPEWAESTGLRLRSSVFQILAQAGYVENTRSLELQTVHLTSQVVQYLKARQERYVLRCIQVSND
jgi:hypothetical protein